jgi:hypothetical protein
MSTRVIQKYELSVGILDYDEAALLRAEKEAEEAEKIRLEGLRKMGPMPNMDFLKEKPRIPMVRGPRNRPFYPSTIRAKAR